jgi:hypothetical protein
MVRGGGTGEQSTEHRRRRGRLKPPHPTGRVTQEHLLGELGEEGGNSPRSRRGDLGNQSAARAAAVPQRPGETPTASALVVEPQVAAGRAARALACGGDVGAVISAAQAPLGGGESRVDAVRAHWPC